MSKRLSEIAGALGLAWSGEDVLIDRPALHDDAGPGAICLATSRDYVDSAKARGCAAVLTSEEMETVGPCLRAAKPRVAFAMLLGLFDDRPVPSAGIHPTAVVEETARVEPSASIEAKVVVQADAKIGSGTRIGAGAYIGHGVSIGSDCVIGPGVVIHHRCVLGNNVRVKAGAVIGGEGFGYEWDGAEHVRVPHLGIVVIEDGVDVGSHTCIDRAKTGETRIGRGTKIDNLVQIAHGVQVGPFCLIVSQVGIAGSSELGAGVVLGGQVGMADGVSVGAGAIVGAKSGITGSLPGGKTYMGWPAREAGEMRRIMAAESRLPGILGRLRTLERRAAEPDE